MGHPRIAPSVVSHGRHALGNGGTRPDSLIIVVNCGRLWGLGGLACVVLSGFPLQGVNSFKSLRHPQIWVIPTCCSHSVAVSFYYVHMRFMVMFNMTTW
jgi:hypothetical protein